MNLCAGYLYNYQTREFYNLTYAHDQPEVSLRFGGLYVLMSIRGYKYFFIFFIL